MNLPSVLGRESTVNLPLEIQGGALAPHTQRRLVFRNPADTTDSIRCGSTFPEYVACHISMCGNMWHQPHTRQAFVERHLKNAETQMVSSCGQSWPVGGLKSEGLVVSGSINEGSNAQTAAP